MRPHRSAILVALVGLAATACGAGSDGAEPAGDTSPPPVSEATPTDTDQPASESTGSDESDNAVAPAATEAPSPAPDGSDDVAPAAAEPAPDDAPAEEPVATEPVADEPAPAPLGGRAFAPELQPDADFDGNPLPDLVVRDVGRDQDANIRNILPSDRPVLLWTWAPH